MSTTTSSSVVTETSTTISPLDFFISLIQIPSSTTKIFLWAYLVTFLLGFIGNIFSLLTFCRATLRNVSTGCLFILLAISDTVYLLLAIIDFVEYGLRIQLYHHVAYDQLCRFRVFTVCVAQLFSAWLIVIITADRWIRTIFPFKSHSLCTPRKALLAAGILFIVVFGLNSHMLLPFFGMLLPGIPGLAYAANGINIQYTEFYFLQWTIIQIVTTSLAPSVLMVSMAVHMFFKIRTQKRAIAPQIQLVNVDRSAQHHNQMFILMLSSIGIFFVTTFPLTIDHIVSSYTITDLAGLEKLLIILPIINWIQTLNCAVNFYVYCLTSILFRKEFLKLIGIVRRPGATILTASKHVKTITVAQPQPRN